MEVYVTLHLVPCKLKNTLNSCEVTGAVSIVVYMQSELEVAMQYETPSLKWSRQLYSSTLQSKRTAFLTMK